MAATPKVIDSKVHRRLAVELFNHVWTLLEKDERTRWEELEMIHAAHASRFHWSRAGDEKNLAIGEWQISHVYSTLGRPEPARFHAQRNLDLCREHGIGDFVLAYAYEALARAAAIDGLADEAAALVKKARRASEEIQDESTRRRLEQDLSNIL